MYKKILYSLLLLLTLSGIFTACNENNKNLPSNNKDNHISNTKQTETLKQDIKKNENIKAQKKSLSDKIDEDKSYTTKDDVALYIHTYNKLPNNFITKKQAQNLGWDSSKGNLWKVTDKKSIGGDVFSNREKTLPTKKGRKWYECDINYKGGFRKAERIVFSNDGLIYYTKNHYKTFTQLY